MKIRKIEAYEIICHRCGYAWIPRVAVEKIKTCPGCKSPYWDRPRKSERVGQDVTA